MEREPPTIPVRLTATQIRLQIRLLIRVCDTYRALPDDLVMIHVPLGVIKQKLTAALDRDLSK
jgi:hypothetical protein